MFINRDWERTEEDDFKLNVQPRLDSTLEAVPNWDVHGSMGCWKLIGWTIKERGE